MLSIVGINTIPIIGLYYKKHFGYQKAIKSFPE